MTTRMQAAARRRPLRLGVLADDLTGGMMIASLIEREGAPCPLVTGTEGLEGLERDVSAVVLARKIRLVAADAARAEAKAAGEALRAAGARQLFSKYSALFDSTPAGNIGPIAEALMEVTGADATVFCSAFVERSVTVYQGRLFVGAQLLSESFKRNDPVTPAHNANLVEVLQAQSRERVGLIPRAALVAGPDAVAREMRRQGGARFFIVDAIDAGDMARLVATVRGWPLVTGADSFPPAIARAWPRSARPGSGAPGGLLPAAPGGEAVIAGSCAPATREQIEAFAATRPVRRIDLAAEGDAPDLAARICDWARPRLADGPVCVATSADPDGVAAAQARFGREGAAARADRLLADVARGLHGLGVRKFVVAGGETSGETLKALDVRRVRVAPFDDLFGGYCHQAGPDPLSIVVKAGSVGEPDFFTRAMARMRAADAAAGGGA